MTTKKKKSAALKFLENLTGSKLTFANLITSIRECEELSQAEFAKSLGISRQYLCDIERNRRFISPKAAAEFANKLGYSPQQFVRLCLQDLLDREGLHLTVEIQDAA